jgi:hypothetical protein
VVVSSLQLKHEGSTETAVINEDNHVRNLDSVTPIDFIIILCHFITRCCNFPCSVTVVQLL